MHAVRKEPDRIRSSHLDCESRGYRAPIAKSKGCVSLAFMLPQLGLPFNGRELQRK
jgi:hypothetical protein